MTEQDFIQQGYSPVIAALSAKLSEIVYYDPEKIKFLVASLGCKLLKFYNRNDTQAMLVDAGEYYFVVFRGTQTWTDWLTDFNVTHVPAENHPGQVHRGFKMAISQVWGGILQDLSDDKPIYFAGHSLGAALAVLAASRNPYTTAGVYIFGCPRPGDRCFTRAFNSRLSDVYRHINNTDPVCRVPVTNRWVGKLVYFNWRGKVIYGRFSWWKRLVDRMLGRLNPFDGSVLDDWSDHSIKEYVGLTRRLCS